MCVCLSPFCCHTLTYGVDNDDVLNPLAAIPASVSRDHHPPHTVTAILIPPHDEVCLTLPIPNDLLVFLEVRLNAFFFVWCVVLRAKAEVFRALPHHYLLHTSMVALKKFGRREEVVLPSGEMTFEASVMRHGSPLALCLNWHLPSTFERTPNLDIHSMYVLYLGIAFGVIWRWWYGEIESELRIGWLLLQQSVAFCPVPFLFIL